MLYDNISTQILTEQSINYSILRDDGATFTKQHLINQAKTVIPGSIFLYPMSKSQSQNADAMMKIIPMLKQ